MNEEKYGHDHSISEFERMAEDSEKDVRHRPRASVIPKTGKIIRPRTTRRQWMQGARDRIRDERRELRRRGRWRKKGEEIRRRLSDWAKQDREEYLAAFREVIHVLEFSKPGDIQYTRDLGKCLGKWRSTFLQKGIESCPGRRRPDDPKCRVKREGATCHIDSQVKCHRPRGVTIYKDFLSDVGLSGAKARDYIRLWDTFNMEIEQFNGLKHFQLLLLEQHVRRESKNQDRLLVIKKIRKKKAEIKRMSRDELRRFFSPTPVTIESASQISIPGRAVIDVAKAKSGKSVRLSWPYKDPLLQDEIVSLFEAALRSAR